MTRSSKHIAIAVGVALAVSATAVFATHNAPAKAKGLKIVLTTAYNVCGTSNDSQGTTPPLPACHPPVATTTTSGTHNVGFGIKGGASVQVAVGTGDLKLKVKTVDIQDNGVMIAD